MIRAVGVGAGGHAKVLIDIARRDLQCQVVALTDPRKELWGTRLLGVEIIGGDDQLPLLKEQGVTHAFVGVGSIGNNQLRVRLFDLIKELGFIPLNLIHPDASIASSVTLGAGVTVMAGVVISPGVCIGDNVVIYSGAVIEHDCIIENHGHISPQATLGGGVTVRRGAYIGIGATVIQGVEIGENALVGAGAVVLDNVPSSVTVAGCPARIIKQGGTDG